MPRRAAGAPRPSEQCVAIAEPSLASVVRAQDEKEAFVVARALDGLGNRKVGVDMVEPVEPDAGADGCGLLVLRGPWRGVARVELAEIGEGVELRRVRKAWLRDVVTQFADTLEAGVSQQLRGIERAAEIASAERALLGHQQ